jgi:hypothetical protein
VNSFKLTYRKVNVGKRLKWTREGTSQWHDHIRSRILPTSALRIEICRINRSGSAIPCTDPDLDPAPDPSINKQKNLEKPSFQLFCDCLLALKTYVDVLRESKQ